MRACATRSASARRRSEALSDDLRRECLALGRSEKTVVCREEAGDPTFDDMEVVDDLLFTRWLTAPPT